jgi:hypothetical protein
MLQDLLNEALENPELIGPIHARLVAHEADLIHRDHEDALQATTRTQVQSEDYEGTSLPSFASSPRSGFGNARPVDSLLTDTTTVSLNIDGVPDVA